MMSPEAIRAFQQEAAAKAARAKRKPLALEADDLVHFDSFLRAVRSTPNLGDYVPRGWKMADVRDYVGGYPYFAFFVDKSGFGDPGEPALTIEGLYGLIKSIIYENPDETFGIGLYEEGQFQIHVGLYLKK